MTNFRFARGSKRKTMTNDNFIRVGLTQVYKKGPEGSAAEDSPGANSLQRVRTLRELEFDHEQMHAGTRSATGWKATARSVYASTMNELGFFLGLSGELSARDVMVNRCVLAGLLALLAVAPFGARFFSQAPANQHTAIGRAASTTGSASTVSRPPSTNASVVVPLSAESNCPFPNPGLDTGEYGPPVCADAGSEPLTVKADGASALPAASARDQLEAITVNQLLRQHPELKRYIPQSERSGSLIGQTASSPTH